jgi:hypothetical protein
MSTKPAKPGGRKAKARRVPKPAAPRSRIKTFRDGSAVILDQHGDVVGWIEARTRYRVRQGDKSRPQAGTHG